MTIAPSSSLQGSVWKATFQPVQFLWDAASYFLAPAKTVSCIANRDLSWATILWTMTVWLIGSSVYQGHHFVRLGGTILGLPAVLLPSDSRTWFFIVVSSIVSFLAIVLSGAFLYLLIKVMGGSASAKKVFSAFNLVLFVPLIAAILAYLLRLLYISEVSDPLSAWFVDYLTWLNVSDGVVTVIVISVVYLIARSIGGLSQLASAIVISVHAGAFMAGFLLLRPYGSKPYMLEIFNSIYRFT